MASPSLAADASAWDKDVRTEARLIAASAGRDGGKPVLRAGIEIRLKPGWKTYWRYPGDSGVPPQIDLSRSDNVGSVTVLWPAPARFEDGAGGFSIGYKGSVILPLHVTPADPSRPATLRLDLHYGACESLCVPAQAKAELVLTGKAGSQDQALAAAEAKVPAAVAVGGNGTPGIRAVRRESGDKPRIVVDVAAADGAAVDLFAEGPTADWALPLPERVKGAPAGVHRFAFAIDGLPPGAKADGAVLRLTAVADGKSVEAPFRLD